MKARTTPLCQLPVILLLVCLFSNTTFSQTIVYVNGANTGVANGATWATGFRYLQDAIIYAATNSQIWVKAGTYNPTLNPGGCSGCTTDARFRAFKMRNGVAIYGGFAGTETLLSQRNVYANQTILSGDNGTPGYNADNAFHVVMSVSNDNTAVLDGFTITKGNAVGNDIGVDGQSVYGVYGGGIYMMVSNPVIRNCTIIANNCREHGGGVYINTSSPVLTNCNIVNNTGEWGGGVYVVNDCAARLINCNISYNTVTNIGNGTLGAGVMNNLNSLALRLLNCTIAYNSSVNGYGCAIYNYGINTTITNCIIWGNTGTNPAVYNDTYNPVVSYNNSQDGAAGTGSITADPLFTNSGDGDGADNVWGTADDGLRLQHISNCFDKGSNAALPSNVTTDITNDVRIQNSIVDLGAYEGRVCKTCTIAYVDSSRAFSGNGYNWSMAFKTLQEALTAANNSYIQQIWVKKGTYFPSAWPDGCSNCTTNRDFTFQLKNNVLIYGGFNGNESLLTQRNTGARPTILSGDIGVRNNAGDNCRHVVLSVNNNNTAVLDGFAIAGGRADGITNYAITRGGTNFQFVNNVGGGVFTITSSALINNCSFADNTATKGGGMANISANTIALKNCSFAGNTATQFGGAIYNEATNALATNCTIAYNTATTGGGIYNVYGNTSFINSISWGNTGGAFSTSSGVHTATYSLIEGGYAGINNLNTNPRFMNSSDPDGTDNILGTTDDGLRLRSNSPALNVGLNTALPSGTAVDLTGATRILDVTIDMGAYEGGFIVLPLNFLSFSGKAIREDAVLQWETDAEVNTAYFEVERSTNGIGYTAIGRMAATNTNGHHSYAFTDTKAASLGKGVYYRLKQVDVDGNYTYSPFVQVSFDALIADAMIYPNPANNNTTLRITIDEPQLLQLQFLTSTGQVMKQTGISVTAGSTLLPLHLSELPQGVYYITIKGNNFTKQLKLIKK